jgi:hypothetical protein
MCTVSTGEEAAAVYIYTSSSPFNQLSMSDYMSEGRAIAPTIWMDQIQALLGNSSSLEPVYNDLSMQNISLRTSASRAGDQKT